MGSGYRDLVLWQKAMDLVERVYRASEDFPPPERYGLTAQLRRAAVSVPSNVAEGQGRRRRREFLKYLSIAYGSLMELETQIEIARRLEYLGQGPSDELFGATAETGRLLNGLIASLSRDANPSTDN
jgi:four helix bundle protein